MLWLIHKMYWSQNSTNVMYYIYIYIYIYIDELCVLIIVIEENHRLVVPYPWPSLATPPYGLSLPAGPQGYTPYPHRFERVTLLLLGHMKGSIGAHHLWAHLYFSSSLVRLTLIVFMMRGKKKIDCQVQIVDLVVWVTTYGNAFGNILSP